MFARWLLNEDDLRLFNACPEVFVLVNELLVLCPNFSELLRDDVESSSLSSLNRKPLRDAFRDKLRCISERCIETRQPLALISASFICGLCFDARDGLRTANSKLINADVAWNFDK